MMQDFHSFYLTEKKLTLYRGYSAEDKLHGESPFVWFSPDEKLAKEYSLTRKNPTVTQVSVDPKRVVDYGKSETRMDIKEFMVVAIKQSKVDFKAVRGTALALREKLIARYGTKKMTLDKFWYQDFDVAEFLSILGFDTIHTTEGGKSTYGINRHGLDL